MRVIGKNIFAAVLFFFGTFAVAQNTTTVSGTVKDTNGVPYSNATVQAQLLPIGVTPTIPPPCNGQSATPCVVSAFSRGSTDSGGNLSMSLASNAVLSPGGTQWQFTVNTTGAPPPLGTGPQQCTATVTISGGSQSITSSFSACPVLSNITGGGANPAGNNGDVQIKNGTNLGAGGANDSNGVFSVTDDFSPLINPYADVRRYHARALSPSGAPAIAGATINCISGNNNATVSNGALFVIGDGIDAYGCGTATGMSTPAAPTIVGSLGTAPTNTGYVVAAPAGGAFTECAKVIARSKGGGLTAPSPEACTTGQTPGQQSVTLLTCSTANNVNTCTTAARSPEVLAATMMMSISGTLDANGLNADKLYGGTVRVASVPNNTSFTYLSNMDTRAGAVSGATGGTGTYFYSYHVTPPAPGTNVFQYGFCTGASGAETFRNTSNVTNSNLSTDPAYQVFDEYGSPITTAASVPDRWPAACNNSATSNDLVTTITGIAANVLTLSAAPSTTPAGATSLYIDACPVVTNAYVAQATNQQMIAFPPPTFGNAFVFNSLCDLSSFGGVGTSITGNAIVLRDTLISNGVWKGDLIPASLSTPQFALHGTSAITIATANPGIITNTGGRFSGINFVVNGNGYHAFYVNGGSIPTGLWENNSFSGGGGTDYSGILVTLFTNPTAGSNASGVTFRDNLFNAGGQGFTPLFADYNFGEVNILGGMVAHRGFFARNGGTLYGFNLDQRYEIQGGVMPLVTTSGTGGIAVTMKNVVLDTTSQPKLANLSVAQVTLAADNGGQPSGGIPMISGNPLAQDVGDTPPNAGLPNSGINTNVEGISPGTIVDGIFGVGNAPANQAVDLRNIHTQIGPGYSFFTSAGQPAAPTCVTNTAGPPFSPAQTNTTFAYTALYPNGGAGLLSPRSNACSSNGTTQQIVVTIPSAVSQATGYNVYGNSLVGCSTPSTVGLTFVATAAYCGNQPPNQPGSGPAGIQNGLIWGQNIQGGVGSSLNAASPQLAFYLANQCLPTNLGQCFFTPEDTKIDLTCTWSNASNVLPCSDNPFHTDGSDIGKQVGGWSSAATDQASNQYSNPISTSTIVTISSVTDSGHAVLSATPANTQATPGYFVFGHSDDTAAAALDAAIAALPSTAPCPWIHFTNGHYLFNNPHFGNQPAPCAALVGLVGTSTGFGNLDLPQGQTLQGGGVGHTVIHLGTGFPGTTTCNQFTYNTHAACFAIPPLGRWRDFQISGDGQFNTCGTLTGNNNILLYSAVGMIQDILLTNWCGSATTRSSITGIYADLLTIFNTVNNSGFGDIGVKTGNGYVTGVRLVIENNPTSNIQFQSGGGQAWQFDCLFCIFNGSASQTSANGVILNGGANIRLRGGLVSVSPVAGSFSGTKLYNANSGTSTALFDGVTFIGGTATSTVDIFCTSTCINFYRDTTLTASSAGSPFTIQDFTANSLHYDLGGNTFGLANLANFTPMIADGKILTGTCTGTANASVTNSLYGTGPNVTGTTCAAQTSTLGTGVPMLQARTLSGLICTSTATTVSVACTVMVNGSPSTLTCTMTAATRCADQTHTVAVNRGDLVSMRIVTGAAETGANIIQSVMWQ